jgi:hypothetical protein
MLEVASLIRDCKNIQAILAVPLSNIWPCIREDLYLGTLISPQWSKAPLQWGKNWPSPKPSKAACLLRICRILALLNRSLIGNPKNWIMWSPYWQNKTSYHHRWQSHCLFTISISWYFAGLRGERPRHSTHHQDRCSMRLPSRQAW